MANQKPKLVAKKKTFEDIATEVFSTVGLDHLQSIYIDVPNQKWYHINTEKNFKATKANPEPTLKEAKRADFEKDVAALKELKEEE